MIYLEMSDYSENAKNVYLLQTNNTVYGEVYKIGIATNPYDRVYTSRSNIYSSLSNPIYIIKTFRTDKFAFLERQLHQKFKELRICINGSGGTEWFKLETFEILNFFNTCKTILNIDKDVIINEIYYNPIINERKVLDIPIFCFNVTQKQLDAAMDSLNNL